MATKLPGLTEPRTTGWLPGFEAWRPFESLRREVDRLFADFDRDIGSAPFRGVPMTADSPAVDLIETDGGYEITAELPGLDQKDITVTLDKDVLTIKGQKQTDKEEKATDYVVHERRFGSFERAFRLPDGVDASKIDATFAKGVLTLTLPKTAEAAKAAQTIAVKPG